MDTSTLLDSVEPSSGAGESTSKPVFSTNLDAAKAQEMQALTQQYQYKLLQLEYERSKVTWASERIKLDSQRDELLKQVDDLTLQRDELYERAKQRENEFSDEANGLKEQIKGLQARERELMADREELRERLYQEQAQTTKAEQEALFQPMPIDSQPVSELAADLTAAKQTIAAMELKLEQLTHEKENLAGQLTAQVDFIALRDRLLVDGLEYQELSASVAKLRAETEKMVSLKLTAERLLAAERRLQRLETVEQEYLQLLKEVPLAKSQKVVQSDSAAAFLEDVQAKDKTIQQQAAQISSLLSDTKTLKEQQALLQSQYESAALKAKEASSLAAVKDEHILRLKKQLDTFLHK